MPGRHRRGAGQSGWPNRHVGNPLPGSRTPEVAYATAQSHLAYYRILEQRGELRLLTT
ncbi:MAG: hypothetical protein U0232_28820 [Thermomicrobiales bacterium]